MGKNRKATQCDISVDVVVIIEMNEKASPIGYQTYGEQVATQANVAQAYADQLLATTPLADREPTGFYSWSPWGFLFRYTLEDAKFREIPPLEKQKGATIKWWYEVCVAIGMGDKTELNFDPKKVFAKAYTCLKKKFNMRFEFLDNYYTAKEAVFVFGLEK
jgi:hypothetical protein